jgi:hypothetical protein
LCRGNREKGEQEKQQGARVRTNHRILRNLLKISRRIRQNAYRLFPAFAAAFLPVGFDGFAGGGFLPALEAAFAAGFPFAAATFAVGALDGGLTERAFAPTAGLAGTAGGFTEKDGAAAGGFTERAGGLTERALALAGDFPETSGALAGGFTEIASDLAGGLAADFTAAGGVDTGLPPLLPLAATGAGAALLTARTAGVLVGEAAGVDCVLDKISCGFAETAAGLAAGAGFASPLGLGDA